MGAHTSTGPIRNFRGEGGECVKIEYLKRKTKKKILNVGEVQNGFCRSRHIL